MWQGGDPLCESYQELDLAAFQELATSFARGVTRGCLIALRGDLGSGKTTFCKGMIKYLSQDVFSGSPTFGIINEYSCRDFLLYHIDLYRISSFREVCEIGILDIMEGNVLLVEWPDLLFERVKFDVEITIRHTVGREDSMRNVEIRRSEIR